MVSGIYIQRLAIFIPEVLILLDNFLQAYILSSHQLSQILSTLNWASIINPKSISLRHASRKYLFIKNFFLTEVHDQSELTIFHQS